MVNTPGGSSYFHANLLPPTQLLDAFLDGLATNTGVGMEILAVRPSIMGGAGTTLSVAPNTIPILPDPTPGRVPWIVDSKSAAAQELLLTQKAYVTIDLVRSGSGFWGVREHALSAPLGIYSS